ncbi:MAG: hypothetical protein AB7N73_12250 [Gemmatimonadales bacterium]|jgi:hypothetical protein
MALTDHLASGELGHWFARRMPGSTALAGEIAAAASTVAPVRPPHAVRVTGRHWAEVGGTFGLRLAALVQPAPPYYALLGLVGNGMITTRAANAIAAGYPSHRDLDPADIRRALVMHPVPGGWLAAEPALADNHSTGWADAALRDLAARTHTYHDQHAWTGVLGTAGAERGLARSYGAWSLIEDVYRAGVIGESLLELLDDPSPTAEQFRALPPAAVVDEQPALAARLEHSGALAKLRALAGDPPPGAALGIAGPPFVRHWADGDLLVGDTLIDVKTVLRATDLARVSRWVWQVLSYAWLDAGADRYRIRAVGLYLARHGILLRWETAELVSLLVGAHVDHDAVRGEFLALARIAAAADGASPQV